MEDRHRKVSEAGLLSDALGRSAGSEPGSRWSCGFPALGEAQGDYLERGDGESGAMF